MRVIFEIARLFAIVAAVGLWAVGSGCAKPEAPATPPSTGLDAGSTTGGGAEVPMGDDVIEDGAPEGDTTIESETLPTPEEVDAPTEPAETETPAESPEGDAPARPAAEGDAPAKPAAEGDAPAKPAAEGDAPAKPAAE